MHGRGCECLARVDSSDDDTNGFVCDVIRGRNLLLPSAGDQTATAAFYVAFRGKGGRTDLLQYNNARSKTKLRDIPTTKKYENKICNSAIFLSFFFSSQGFFIFLLHILRNADVRAEFKRKKRMWFQMRGRVADLHSSDKCTSKAIRSDAFELNEKHYISSSHVSSRNKNQVVPFQDSLPSVKRN